MAMGDKSSFDVFISIWGENLEKCSLACKQEILKEVNRITTVGGCYESEGFFRTTCEGEPLTIKPLTWFRSRDEVDKLRSILESE